MSRFRIFRSQRFVTGSLSLLIGLALLHFVFPFDVAFVLMAGLVLAVTSGVVVAFWKAAIDALGADSLEDGDHLVLGMVIETSAVIMIVTYALVNRIFGWPERLIDSPILLIILQLLLIGAALKLTGPFTASGRLQAAGRRRLGMWVFIGLATGVIVVVGLLWEVYGGGRG